MPAPEVQDKIVERMDNARNRSEELLLRAQSLREESINEIASARQSMMDTLAKQH
jgi:hypothetical protein